MSRRSVRKRRRIVDRKVDDRASKPDSDPPRGEPGETAEAEPPPRSVETTPAPASARQRIVLAAAMALTVIIVGGVLLLGGSDGGEASAAAPTECVDAWNEASIARGTGAHAASGHGYTRAWVVHLSADFEPSDDADDCAVVFPSEQLDPEPYFAGAIMDGERWRPLSRATEISDERLGALQRDALSSANAQLLPDGTLARL